MPKVVDAEAQRRDICRAARHVFSRRGIAGTGLAHVAKAAGMGRSSLYHYYRDKETLLADLVRQTLDEEAALFAAVLQGEGTAAERIERLMRALLGEFEHWTETGRLLFDLRLGDARRFAPFFREVRASLARVIAEGQAAGELDPSLDTELAAATLIGAVDGLLLQHVSDDTAFPDARLLDRTLFCIMRKALAP